MENPAKVPQENVNEDPEGSQRIDEVTIESENVDEQLAVNLATKIGQFETLVPAILIQKARVAE